MNICSDIEIFGCILRAIELAIGTIQVKIMSAEWQPNRTCLAIRCCDFSVAVLFMCVEQKILYSPCSALSGGKCVWPWSVSQYRHRSPHVVRMKEDL